MPEWVCPNCGESIGEPREIRSREYQGEEPHGGVVETIEEACTLCIKEIRLRECGGFTDAEIVAIMDEYRTAREELEGR